MGRLRDTIAYVAANLTATMTRPSGVGKQHIIPAKIFTDFINANSAAQCWNAPLTVFTATGVAALQTNLTLTLRWSMNYPPTQKAQANAFVSVVSIENWKAFIARIDRVIDDIKQKLAERKRTHPRRITFLFVSSALDTASAWLSGYAWSRLHSEIDFVVNDVFHYKLCIALIRNRCRGSESWLDLALRVSALILSGDVQHLPIPVDIVYINDMLLKNTSLSHDIINYNDPGKLACTFFLCIPYVSTTDSTTTDGSIALVKSKHALQLSTLGDAIAPSIDAFLGSVAAAGGTTVNRDIRQSGSSDLRVGRTHNFSKFLAFFESVRPATRPLLVFEHRLRNDDDADDIVRKLVEEGDPTVGLEPLVSNAKQLLADGRADPFYMKTQWTKPGPVAAVIKDWPSAFEKA